ncbi:MAG: hypothetical protein ABI625_10155 [bacterium]
MLTYDASHDFDFLHGSWHVHNRKLHQRLTGSTDWFEFEGTAVERPLWGGQANIEEYEADMPSGRVRGLALRLFNPHSRQWSIHWSGSTTGTLDNPVTGEFRDGRGQFYGVDTCDGRQVLARFIWTPIAADACRWEQAFSPDGGTTWETNWIMEFSRAR